MAAKFIWYTVKLSLQGVTNKDAPTITNDIQEELQARPHLRKPQAHWKSGTSQMIVTVEIESSSGKNAAHGISEELLEIAVAILPEFEHIHVEIIDFNESIT